MVSSVAIFSNAGLRGLLSGSFAGSELALNNTGWALATVRSAGTGGGTALGRRCSRIDLRLAMEPGWMMLITLPLFGDEGGEEDGEAGLLLLYPRGPELAETLTLIFLPLAACQALQ